MVIEDLKGKQLLKIMWVPGAESLLWNMKDESQLSSQSAIYKLVEGNSEIVSWASRFDQLYEQWLEGDNDVIYDVKHEVNREILSILRTLNTSLSELAIFYWFDVDRTDNDDFVWTESPFSGKPLLDLGPDYHFLNRLVSLEDYVVFPKYR
jgi:hypothetical protein